MQTKNRVGFTVHTLTAEYEKAALDLFVKSFCNDEPMTSHLDITVEEYTPYAAAFIKKAIKDGLSKVIVDGDSGNKLIGVGIIEDLANPFIPDFARYPKIKPVYEVLESLSKPFIKGKTFAKGKVGHACIAVVDPTYRHHGISTTICTSCCEGLAYKGYEFCYSEFTNSLSEKMVTHLDNCHFINRVEYSSFKNADGKTPFKGLGGSASAYVAILKPGLTLDALDDCYTKGNTGK